MFWMLPTWICAVWLSPILCHWGRGRDTVSLGLIMVRWHKTCAWIKCWIYALGWSRNKQVRVYHPNGSLINGGAGYMIPSDPKSRSVGIPHLFSRALADPGSFWANAFHAFPKSLEFHENLRLFSRVKETWTSLSGKVYFKLHKFTAVCKKSKSGEFLEVGEIVFG